MDVVRKIPEGFHSITPALIVKNADAAIEFYKKVLEPKRGVV
jgi:catechol 2,3-dioxygenase-like lactoylglutathione lyase family enzyme